jgi:hypothetical protein
LEFTDVSEVLAASIIITIINQHQRWPVIKTCTDIRLKITNNGRAISVPNNRNQATAIHPHVSFFYSCFNVLPETHKFHIFHLKTPPKTRKKEYDPKCFCFSA